MIIIIIIMWNKCCITGLQICVVMLNEEKFIICYGTKSNDSTYMLAFDIIMSYEEENVDVIKYK